MEDAAREEALVFMIDIGAICRVAGWQDSRTEYRVVTNNGDHRTLAAVFAGGGFAALDLHGLWLPDAESFLQARSVHLRQRAAHVVPQGGGELRAEFDRSALRRTLC